MNERLKGPEVEGKREPEYFPTHIKYVEGLVELINKEIHFNPEVRHKLEKDANAVSATKFETARTLQTDLESTDAPLFDGTKNILIGVRNILPVVHGGTGKNDLANVTVGAASKATLDSANHEISTYFAPVNSPTLKGIPQSVTFTDLDDDSDKIATTAFVAATIRRLMGATPSELDTLQELAVAINNDPDFHNSITKVLNDLDSRLRGQSSAYVNPKSNQIWFDSKERTVKMFNNDSGLWENFEVSSTNEPQNPVHNQIWFDVNSRSVKIYNAETGLWENFEITSIDEPDNPVSNQTWFDVNDNTIKKYNSTTGEWEIFVAKPVKKEITIPNAGWVLDESETTDYKYYFEISVADLKPADIVEIFYSRGSISTVLEAGVCPSDNQAMEGCFRIYAAAIPTEPINASYVVWKG